MSSLQLSVCNGVTAHIEFKCHLKQFQKNYTLIQQLKVIEYTENDRSEKHKSDVHVEILIAGRMIIILIFFAHTKQNTLCYQRKDKTQKERTEFNQ